MNKNSPVSQNLAAAQTELTIETNAEEALS